MAKPNTKTPRRKISTLTIVLLSLLGAFVLCVAVAAVVQNGPWPTNTQQCEIDLRAQSADYEQSPLYEPPVSCLRAIHEPDARYDVGD